MTSKLKKIEVIYGGYKVKKGIYAGLAIFILLILTASLSGLIHTYKLERNSTIVNVNKETQAASIDKIHDIEGIKKSKEMPYMIYYGKLDKKTIDMAKTYRLVIINPMTGNVTRSQVKEIQQGLNPDNPSDDVIVLGYISIGEDLRTGNLTDEQMLQDKRFTGDGTGPRVDPRGPIPKSDKSLEGIEVLGKASPGAGGDGYACWYLDDNNYDGKPDRNGIFKCAFVNAGDPAWFDIVNKMTMDGEDKVPGLAEILTLDTGRGLGCNGVFLDTIDTCAPNIYTDSNSANKTQFEWTAAGFSSFIEKVHKSYPNSLVLQNRGLFFFNPNLPHYKLAATPNIDFLMFESYRLDSNTANEYNEAFFKDNKNNFMRKIMAEANRGKGFRVLSLGYAEGPPQFMLKETLMGQSKEGLSSLDKDIQEAQDIAGFSHYITDAALTLLNTFVKDHSDSTDSTPPSWSSTYNASVNWPPDPPEPRVGIQQAVPEKSAVTVRWDVALDKNRVKYALYYQTEPFDFKNDYKLSLAKRIVLDPQMGKDYSKGTGPNVYPYEQKIEGLSSNQQYYFIIRAFDESATNNEEKNERVLSVITE
jgi:endo-alpha-1,4-polygalactosaminidase (GH114 family)